MAKNTSCGVQLRIRGKVQGVVFVPFVWQLAQQLNLHGDVCNDGDGVEVRLLERAGNLSCSIASALSAAGAY
ncbi:acylphosphatase [Klebsiella pneumoniae]|uniref:acylphosphatase n=1 Tax=Klebsiella pneumoniae TaxID=573 RepID=UPI003890DD4D